MEATAQASMVPINRGLNLLSGFALVSCIVSHVPLLLWHTRELARRPHYQFYPFALACAAYLAWTRWPRDTTITSGDPKTNFALTSFAWLLLAAAVLGGSPYLGAVAFFFVLVALIHGIGGRALLWSLYPSFIMTLLTFYPPLGFDHEVIVWLRRIATQASSGVLDMIGIAHAVAGNVIETEKERLMVEDACSGINSLLSVCSCVLFYLFLVQRGWIYSGLLLGISAYWVLLANASRVIIVTYYSTKGGPLLTEGWRHEALGFGLFTLSLIMTLSSDRLLLFLFTAPPVDPNMVLSPETPAPLPVEQAGQPSSRVSLPAHLLPSVGAAYVLLFVVQIVVTPLSMMLNVDSPLFQATARVIEQTAPEKIAGWQREKYEDKKRGTGSPLGEFSKNWTYRSGNHRAVLSLDYPFGEWHELGLCYVAQGWFVEQRVARNVPDGWVIMRINKPGGRSGLVLFNNLDYRGECLDPGGWAHDISLVGRLYNRARRILLALSTSYRRVGPLAQLQLLSEWEGPPDEERENQLIQLFRSGRQSIENAFQGREGSEP